MLFRRGFRMAAKGVSGVDRIESPEAEVRGFPPYARKKRRIGHPAFTGGSKVGHPPERFVGSCRRDLLDQVIVLNERHLKRLMTEYVRYYHEDRTHLGLSKRTPVGRAAAVDTDATCEVFAMPRVGGLHHRYS